MPIRDENRGRYPADWALRSVFVRFVRAGGRCEWCGAKHGERHPLTGSTVVLTTAHVHDKRPERAELLNLAALCQRCHLRHDAGDRRELRRTQRDQVEAASGQLRFFAAEVDAGRQRWMESRRRRYRQS